MKISIITVSYNSAATIQKTIESVIAQAYSDIEYIIIDGKSTDGTQDIVQKYQSQISAFISEKDNGMYDAINKGIGMAAGDIIGLLNSDDFFVSPNVVSQIIEAFHQSKADVVFANVAFIKRHSNNKVVRHYSSRHFAPAKFKYGYMPAHPTFYVKKNCYDQFGLYKLDYKIAADYELVMRFLFTHKLNFYHIDKTLIYMQAGGISNQNLKSRYVLNKEIIKACKANGVNTNLLLLSLKYFSKVFEFVTPKLSGRKID